MKFLKSVWSNIVFVLAAIVGVMLYLLKRKNEQLNAYKAKVDLVKTQKEADLIEAEINAKLKEKNLLVKEREDLEDLIEELNIIREELKDTRKESDKEDYWNN